MSMILPWPVVSRSMSHCAPMYSFGSAHLFSREGNDMPLQYSCLENPMDRRAWWAAIHGVTKESDTIEGLHFHFSLSCIGEGNGNPLQCSCLEHPRDRGAWWAAIYEVAQSRTRLKWLSSSSSSTCSQPEKCSLTGSRELLQTLPGSPGIQGPYKSEFTSIPFGCTHVHC